MENLLKPTILKLNRASVQGSEICRIVDKWCDETKIPVDVEFLDRRRGYRLIIKDFEEPQLFDELGLMLGEFIHNIRSSLDNLAYALARLHQDPPTNPGQISFPVNKVQAEFESNAKPKLLRHLSVDAVQLIEAWQPFQRLNPSVEGTPETDGLFGLHYLSNQDKHRIPSIVCLRPSANDLKSFATIEFYSDHHEEPKQEFFGYPIKSGAVLMECKTNEPIKEVSGQFTSSAQIGVEIPTGFGPLDGSVKELFTYTTMIVNSFTHFFKPVS